MIVYVAYTDDEIGLPVAMGDTMAALGRELGISGDKVFRIKSGLQKSDTRNKFGQYLTIHEIEIDYDPETDIDSDEELDLDDLADIGDDVEGDEDEH